MTLCYVLFIFGKNVGKEEVKTLGGEKGGKKRAGFVEGLDSNSVEYCNNTLSHSSIHLSSKNEELDLILCT